MIAPNLLLWATDPSLAPLPTLTWKDVTSRLLAVFLLIAINAFFVAAEFSIVSVRRSRINQLVDTGDIPAQTVQALQRNLDRFLSTTQLGITLSSLALGWIGEGTLAILVTSCLKFFPLPRGTQDVIAHSLAIPLITFFFLAYIQIVLGELCPKSVALLYSERLSRLLGTPSLAIARIFNPFVSILNQSTRCLLKFFGIEYKNMMWKAPVTPEELQLIITTSSESTGLEAEERELLNNVFEFGDVQASEVMVPRTSIDAISKNDTFQDLLNEIALSSHSCYPVIGESLDDILGLLDFKELAKPLAEGSLSRAAPIQSWIRPAKFVPEQTRLSELLPLIQRLHPAMVIVVDEFGGTAGLVTLQDLVSEIIGDSYEGVDAEEITLQMIDDQTFLAQAQLDIEDVNELLTMNLPVGEEYQTLGGFMIYQLQKIPEVGESLVYENLELTVMVAEGPRLDQIKIRRRDLTVDNEQLNPES